MRKKVILILVQTIAFSDENIDHWLLPGSPGSCGCETMINQNLIICLNEALRSNKCHTFEIADRISYLSSDEICISGNKVNLHWEKHPILRASPEFNVSLKRVMIPGRAATENCNATSITWAAEATEAHKVSPANGNIDPVECAVDATAGKPAGESWMTQEKGDVLEIQIYEAHAIPSSLEETYLQVSLDQACVLAPVPRASHFEIITAYFWPADGSAS